MKSKKAAKLVLIFPLVGILALTIYQSNVFLKLDGNKVVNSNFDLLDLPEFQFYDLSNNLITNRQFLKGRSLVLIHVDTSCDLCSNKIKSLLKYIDLFEKTDIILSSSEDKNALESFYESNKLHLYPQIFLVQSRSGFFYEKFGSSFIPLILVFNEDGVLVKKIDDLVPIGTIIKYIKIANNEEIE